MDLRDVWRGGLTLRRLRTLIEQLPPESALQRKLAAVDGWSVGDFLLADVFHVLAGKPHPARPAAPIESKSLPAGIEKALREHARRQAEELR